MSNGLSPLLPRVPCISHVTHTFNFARSNHFGREVQDLARTDVLLLEVLVLDLQEVSHNLLLRMLLAATCVPRTLISLVYFAACARHLAIIDGSSCLYLELLYLVHHVIFYFV